MNWDSLEMELFIAAFVLLLIYAIRSIRRPNKKDKLPPGPFNIPIIGNFHIFMKTPHLTLMDMARKYGDVISINIGPFKCVSLNSAKSIRDAFNKPEFLGRPDEIISNMTDMIMPLFSNGKLWTEHRRFVLRAFRDLGLGKNKMYDLIMEEVDFVLKRLAKEEGNVCDVRTILTPSTANNITSLMFGKRYDHDDPERIYMDEKIAYQNKSLISGSILAFFPWVKKVTILSRLLKLDELLENNLCLEKFVAKKIREHKEVFDEDELKDFVDIYLSEMNSRKERDPDTTLSENCMPGTILNLFSAGSETVRSSIEWALHTMALYPEIQKKVQHQLDNVIGCERSPMADDMKNMPYVQAILAELQRWKTVVPIGPHRKVLEDVEIYGYIIPKGTLVLANFWAAHNDPQYWKNPKEFKPERFLTPDGKYLNKDDNYLPFSIGKRACPGEGLALVEVFLYFASILQKFDVKFPEGTEPDFQDESTIVYQLKTCKFQFVPRNKS